MALPAFLPLFQPPLTTVAPGRFGGLLHLGDEQGTPAVQCERRSGMRRLLGLDKLRRLEMSQAGRYSLRDLTHEWANKRDEVAVDPQMLYFKDVYGGVGAGIDEELIRSLLSESLKMPHWSLQTGSTVAACWDTTRENVGRALLFSATGAHCDYLSIQLFHSSDTAITTRRVHGAIRQIAVTADANGDILCGVLADRATFYVLRQPTAEDLDAAFINDDVDEPGDAEILPSYYLAALPAFAPTASNPSFPAWLTLSPHGVFEAHVLLADGSVHGWDARGVTVAAVPPRAAAEGDDLVPPWGVIEYAAHPRMLYRATSGGVDVLDLRGRAPVNLFSAPGDDLLCALARHPTTPFQYVVASARHVTLLDERYPRAALLQWEHGYENPPCFLSLHEYMDDDEHVTVIYGANRASEITAHFYSAGTIDGVELPSCLADTLPARAPLAPRSIDLPLRMPSVGMCMSRADTARPGGVCAGLAVVGIVPVVKPSTHACGHLGCEWTSAGRTLEERNKSQARHEEAAHLRAHREHAEHVAEYGTALAGCAACRRLVRTDTWTRDAVARVLQRRDGDSALAGSGHVRARLEADGAGADEVARRLSRVVAFDSRYHRDRLRLQRAWVTVGSKPEPSPLLPPPTAEAMDTGEARGPDDEPERPGLPCPHLGCSFVCRKAKAPQAGLRVHEMRKHMNMKHFTTYGVECLACFDNFASGKWDPNFTGDEPNDDTSSVEAATGTALLCHGNVAGDVFCQQLALCRTVPPADGMVPRDLLKGSRLERELLAPRSMEALGRQRIVSMESVQEEVRLRNNRPTRAPSQQSYARDASVCSHVGCGYLTTGKSIRERALQQEAHEINTVRHAGHATPEDCAKCERIGRAAESPALVARRLLMDALDAASLQSVQTTLRQFLESPRTLAELMVQLTAKHGLIYVPDVVDAYLSLALDDAGEPIYDRHSRAPTSTDPSDIHFSLRAKAPVSSSSELTMLRGLWASGEPPQSSSAELTSPRPSAPQFVSPGRPRQPITPKRTHQSSPRPSIFTSPTARAPVASQSPRVDDEAMAFTQPVPRAPAMSASRPAAESASQPVARDRPPRKAAPKRRQTGF